ncbi:MAG TPA: hypothetical protein ENJ44_05090 [Oceanospirillales bacterium]|nr:hypothetical protein [Oceanospirillales bacterium]
MSKQHYFEARQYFLYAFIGFVTAVTVYQVSLAKMNAVVLIWMYPHSLSNFIWIKAITKKVAPHSGLFYCLNISSKNHSDNSP